MEDIITFIKDNYWWLIVVISGVVEFILLLLCKRKPINTFIDNYYEELVTLIIAAENKFGVGHGEEKMKFVKSMFLIAHPEKRFYPISTAVENILSTPQKKGV